MSQELAGRGWLSAPLGVGADLHLVNTCTVTGRADQQARQAIRRLSREYRQLPSGSPAVTPSGRLWSWRPSTGSKPCWATGKRARWRNYGKSLLPAPTPGFGSMPARAANPFGPGGCRAFPGTPGPGSRSRRAAATVAATASSPRCGGPVGAAPPAGAAAALRELAAAGYQEVVLTGIDLGQYGQDLNPPFGLAGLVQRLQEDGAPLRVRLSSLEPQEVTGDLLAELASWRNFCPHFHLPLQSGSASILNAMNRPYRPGEFRDLVLEIARLFPEAALGLDVLVGFPGESAADFEASLTLVASLPVTYLHVFPFSARPGTPAARLQAVPSRELQRRAGIIRELGRQKRLAFTQGQTERLREVLVEGPAPQPGWLQGLSDNYLRVVFPGPAAWRNRRLLVRLLGIKEDRLLGEALAGPNEPGENPS